MHYTRHYTESKFMKGTITDTLRAKDITILI